MVKALQNQPDFLEQKTALEEFFESKGRMQNAPENAP